MEEDAEKRHYLWQHYFSELNKSLRNLKLSPAYKSVNETIEDLSGFIQNTHKFSHPNRDIIGADMVNAKWIYKKSEHQLDMEARATEIKETYFPKLRSSKQEFYSLKQYAYDNMSIEQIGISTLYQNEGLLLIKISDEPTVNSYKYNLSTVVNKNHRSLINLSYLGSFKETVSSTIYGLKAKLSRRFDYSPNGYLVEIDFDLPFHETILPVAKGKLSQFLGV